jgi:hypothetical protein
MNLTNFVPITQDEFDQFRTNISYNRRFRTLSNLATPVATTSTTPSSSTSHNAPFPVDVFKRGIKRDPSVFPTLKDEDRNDSWHRTFANQARAQDVSDVLDENYKPVTPTDIALFEEKKKYLYAILESKVEMAKGRAIIRKHESSYDAKAAYAELSKYHLKSTKAALSSNKILGYITTARLVMVLGMAPQITSFSIGKNKSAYMSDLFHPLHISLMSKSLPCFRRLFIPSKNLVK